jgi:hypothetical protein
LRVVVVSPGRKFYPIQTTMTFSPYRRSLCAAVAASAALLAACTPSARTGPAPDLPPGRTWTPESPTAEIAAWVNQGCRSSRAARNACVERALTTVLGQAGISRSMQVLDTLAITDPGVRDMAHALAHGLGISAYRSPETLAATFTSCPVSQMSGCFHGVIQGYFLDMAARGRPVGAAELDALCAPHAARQFIWFHCSHGMGHGLMALHQNHLPMALESCDQVSLDFVRESCYSGAIMENAMQVTHPHHTAGGHAQTQGATHGAPPSADAHADHGGHAAGGDAHASHGAAAGAQAMRHGEWRALDPGDMLYPCNALDVKYQAACYGFQPSPVMFFNRGDVAATARMCEQAPEAFRATCFSSLGREVTTWAGQDPGRIIEMCGRVGGAGGGRGKAMCYAGAVASRINQAADPRDGIRFCRAVPDPEGKQACYERVGAFTVTLAADLEARARLCAAAEAEFVAACRRGAEVDPPAPSAGA